MRVKLEAQVKICGTTNTDTLEITDSVDDETCSYCNNKAKYMINFVLVCGQCEAQSMKIIKLAKQTEQLMYNIENNDI